MFNRTELIGSIWDVAIWRRKNRWRSYALIIDQIILEPSLSRFHTLKSVMENSHLINKKEKTDGKASYRAIPLWLPFSSSSSSSSFPSSSFVLLICGGLVSLSLSLCVCVCVCVCVWPMEMLANVNREEEKKKNKKESIYSSSASPSSTSSSSSSSTKYTAALRVCLCVGVYIKRSSSPLFVSSFEQYICGYPNWVNCWVETTKEQNNHLTSNSVSIHSSGVIHIEIVWFHWMPH